MGRKDDDLKLDITDISEIFGGDVSDVKETVEQTQRIATEVQSLSDQERQSLSRISQKDAAERTQEEQAALGNLQIEQALREKEAEIERKYQEMLAAREKELEDRTRELDAHLEKMRQGPAAPSPPPPDVPSASVPAQDGAIDFSAPMPRPFSVSDSTAPKTPKGGEVPQDPQAMQRLQRDHEFLMLYDEIRNLFVLELTPLVGEKKAHIMLARTVEMARAKHPEILKNANWDWEGNIIPTGAVDSQRLFENRKAMPAEAGDVALMAACRTLLELRLKAVEKGLGTGMMNKVRSRLLHWADTRIEKAGRSRSDPTALRRIHDMIPN